MNYFKRWVSDGVLTVWSPGSADTVCPRPADIATALGQDGSDWSRDLATLIFDLRKLEVMAPEADVGS